MPLGALHQRSHQKDERKSRIVKVELFVESVAFTDDTMWAFGSSLRRIKGTSNFENVDQR